MKREAIVDAVEVAAYRIPTDAPEADGTLEWEATEMVVVHVHGAGHRGLGYSYTAARPAALLVSDFLEPCIVGRHAFDVPALWLAMNRALRNIGRPGLGLMAISAVDQALWDLKARILELPLGRLWGHNRDSIPLYGSGGFTTYSAARLRRQLEGWLEQGLPAVKIKVGNGVEADARSLHTARDAVGNGIALMADANGAYDPRSAMGLLPHLRQHNVVWLEEPVSSDDLAGLCWLRSQVPPMVAIAAGEYGWDCRYFRRMLAAGAVDVLQVDATRCGYTGFLQAAQLCDAWQLPLSSHCAPAIHAPVCAAVPRLLHLEYFHDHVRIESQLLEGGASPRNGALWPDPERSGHGLTLRSEVADAYRL